MSIQIDVRKTKSSGLKGPDAIEVDVDETVSTSSLAAFPANAGNVATNNPWTTVGPPGKRGRVATDSGNTSTSSSSSGLLADEAMAAQGMSRDITWDNIEASELAASASQIVARLDIETRPTQDTDRPYVFNKFVAEEFPLIRHTLNCGAQAAQVTLIALTDEIPDLSMCAYRNCFSGSSDQIVEAIRKLNTDTNRAVYRSMLIVQRFLAALTKPPQGYMMTSLGKEGSIFAVSLLAKAMAAEKRIPSKQIESSLKYVTSVESDVAAAFKVAFTGNSKIGESIFELSKRLLTAIGVRYSDPKLIRNIVDHLRLATANFTQLLERSVHVTEQERLVRNTASQNKNSKKKEVVACKRYPTIDTQKAPLLDAERQYCIKYNAYTVKTPAVLAESAECRKLVLTDRLRLVQGVLVRLYAQTKRLSEVLSRRRGTIAQIIRDDRKSKFEGATPIEQRRAAAEPISPAEWNSAETKLLDSLRSKPDDLSVIMLSRPFNDSLAVVAVERVEFSFLGGIIADVLRELSHEEHLVDY